MLAAHPGSPTTTILPPVSKELTARVDLPTATKAPKILAVYGDSFAQIKVDQIAFESNDASGEVACLRPATAPIILSCSESESDSGSHLAAAPKIVFPTAASAPVTRSGTVSPAFASDGVPPAVDASSRSGTLSRAARRATAATRVYAPPADTQTQALDRGVSLHARQKFLDGVLRSATSQRLLEGDAMTFMRLGYARVDTNGHAHAPHMTPGRALLPVATLGHTDVARPRMIPAAGVILPPAALITAAAGRGATPVRDIPPTSSDASASASASASATASASVSVSASHGGADITPTALLNGWSSATAASDTITIHLPRTEQLTGWRRAFHYLDRCISCSC
jgi:hypothetical protein